MHFFDMKGDWGMLPSLLYDRVVSRVFEETYDQLVERLPDCVGPGPVLDIGCGPGSAVLNLARRHPERKIIGVDSSPAMIGSAKERAHAQGIWNAHFELGDACRLSFTDQSASLVLSIASLKHWSLPVKGLDEMMRLAAPGASVALLEIDPHASPDVLRQFVMQWRLLPRLSLEWLPLVRRLGETYFRRVVAGQSYALEDIEGMVRSSTMRDADWCLRQLPDMPFWMLTVQKPLDEKPRAPRA